VWGAGAGSAAGAGLVNICRYMASVSVSPLVLDWEWALVLEWDRLRSTALWKWMPDSSNQGLRISRCARQSLRRNMLLAARAPLAWG
jgi:hypothetical protein